MLSLTVESLQAILLQAAERFVKAKEVVMQVRPANQNWTSRVPHKSKHRYAMIMRHRCRPVDAMSIRTSCTSLTRRVREA